MLFLVAALGLVASAGHVIPRPLYADHGSEESHDPRLSAHFETASHDAFLSEHEEQVSHEPDFSAHFETASHDAFLSEHEEQVSHEPDFSAHFETASHDPFWSSHDECRTSAIMGHI